MGTGKVHKARWSGTEVAVGDGRTPTGHEIDRTYFSLRHLARYRVLGLASKWELAPSECVRLEWENGNCTTSDEPRQDDPELCSICDGALDMFEPLPIEPCRCVPNAAARVAS